jgi:hypothetical protein
MHVWHALMGTQGQTIKEQLIALATLVWMVTTKLCRKLPGKCSSVYTTGMHASNALAYDQGTIHCASNPVWMMTPTTRCVASPRPNAVAFTPLNLSI